MNNDLTDEQRARALELYYTWAESVILGRLYSMTAEDAHAWLAVEAHVLASHTRPDAEPEPEPEPEPDHVGNRARARAGARARDRPITL